MGFDVVYLTPGAPDRHDAPQGPQQLAVRRAGRPRLPVRDRLARRRARRDRADARHVRRLRRASSPRPATLGMEVALDIALQCSPDHPWVTAHPEWFTTRADGTIAYAENPPKKYQDIYPLNFDNDPEGIYTEIRRVLQVWIDHGVTLFRVDNPHTKPLDFWERILAVGARRPPRRDLPVRGVHAAGDDADARQDRLPPVVHVLHLAQHEGRDHRVPGRGLGRAGRVDAAELLADDARHPAAVPAGHGRARASRCAPCWRRSAPRRGASTRATSWSRTCRDRASTSRSTTRSTSSSRATGRKADAIGINLLLGRLNEIRRDAPRAAAAAQPARAPDVATTRSSRSPSTSTAEHSPDRPRRHDRRHRQPRPVEHARGLGRAGPARVRAGPGPARSSRTTCCPTRRTSGVRPSSSGSTRDPRRRTSSTWWRRDRDTRPPPGATRREPAPTTAQIVAAGPPPARAAAPAVEAPGPVRRPASGTAPRCSTRSCSARSPTRSGQGSGDLRGLIDRLDYLQWLGIDCLWLPPFYPSPLRDGGYDVADYTAIAGQYGTMADFTELIEQVHARGMRIVVDLVMNHTSDQHPWFQASRSDPEGPYGDFYVWSRRQHALPGRAHHLRRHRDVQLDLRPRAPAVLLAPVLQPPARPELREPARGRGDARRRPVLAGHRRRRLPARRRAVPVRGRGHQLREPARDARVPAQGPAR